MFGSKHLMINYAFFFDKIKVILSKRMKNIAQIKTFLTSGKLLFVSMFVFFFVLQSKGQFLFDYGFSLGAANYLGEIGGKDQEAQPWLLDLKISQTRWNAGVFGRYKVLQDFSVRGDLSVLQIQGADSLSTNPERVGRNLSFKNNIYHFTLMGEYTFFKDFDVGNSGTYEVNFNMYVSAGVGFFYHDPKAFYQGSWHRLQPLETEGVSYTLFQPSVPFSLGFHYTLRRTQRIGVEIGYNITFTDYLDDISTTYRDTTGLTDLQKALITRPVSEDLQDNLPDQANYEYPSPRGNPNDKDGFMTVKVSYSTVLKGKYKNKKFNPYKRRYRYITSGKKGRRRKAKF